MEPDLRGIDAFTPTEVFQFSRQGRIKNEALLVLVSDLPTIIDRAINPPWTSAAESLPTEADFYTSQRSIITLHRSGRRRFNVYSYGEQGDMRNGLQWQRGDGVADPVTHWMFFDFPPAPTGGSR